MATHKNLTGEQNPIDISIATRPNNVEVLDTLLQDITTDINAFVNGGNVDRKHLVIKCRSLVQALETPRETMLKHCWAQTGAIAALNFGVDSGLWALMAKNGKEPQRVTDLATCLGIDPMLLGRLMRHLGAMGYITETGEDEYTPTNYSLAMSIPVIGNGYLAIPSCTSAGAMKFHEFSRKRGWRNPTDAKDTSMMYAYGTDMDMFSWQKSLGYGTHFNDHMGGYSHGRVPWMAPGFYPVKERLVQGADTDPQAAFLVDIGGSLGHDLVKFKGYHPDTPGKLILQDLPNVINQIKDLDSSIIRMEYDFHTEQPIKGARAYYMHSCLHDWPDEVCEGILARVKSAMKPGYSRLLINENVLPSKDAYWEATALDMVMLTLFSSQERSSSAWHDLLERKAGLRIIQIWTGETGVESLIECFFNPTRGEGAASN
ncbi:hypothetical protein NLG97_g10682 [Lecanicillium saksenae]|uniref:Uncharacterized protein n=1 Tax=Lecanicillium saksenae TaxID=468837 RepID=A0ACC1QCH3_9HYPO|nr:hypothetical protein NLG97_g10682 [Lecanicillium saksenae]